MSVGIFRITALKQKSIIVRGFPKDSDEAGLYEVSVQPMAMWGVGAASDTTSGENDVFVLQDPVKLDVLSTLGADDDARKCLRVCENSQSDVDGCGV